MLRAAEAAGASARAQLRAGCHAFLDAATTGSTARILLLDAPAVLGWAVWRELDAGASQVHLRAALGELGVTEELLDALTVQLSGAMNEAALWLAEQEHPGAREQAHAALDRLLYAVAGPE